MPNTREIAIPAGAAFVTINATLHCRGWKIEEPPLFQGITYQLAQDGFAATHVNQPGEPLLYGNQIPQNVGAAPILGHPATASGGATMAATALVNVATTSMQGETIRFTESE